MGAGLSLIQSMAVNAGQKILLADLVALADEANTLSSATFDLSAFYDISPMYWNSGATSDDGSGKYGYQTSGAIFIVTKGTGYTVGQTGFVGLPWGFYDHPAALKFRIESVDGSGGITAIRLLQTGSNAPGTLTTGVKSVMHPGDATVSHNPLTSDTGSGAQVAITAIQFGPALPYAFPDYDLSTVWYWNFALVSGGLGYTVGNVLTFVDLAGTGAAITVNTVNGSGTILTFTVTHPPGSTTLPANVTAMPVTGGSGTGAAFAGWPTMQPDPAWGMELARLRAAANALQLTGTSTTLANALTPAVLQGISGPWPVSTPTANFTDTNFYYADTGHGESVALVSRFYPSSTGSFRTTVINKLSHDIYTGTGWWPYYGGGLAGPFGLNSGHPADPGYTIGQIITDGIANYEVLDKFDIGSDAWIVYSLRPVEPVVSSLLGLYTTHNEYSMVIGGVDNVTLTGVFYIMASISIGSTIVYTNGSLVSTTPDGTNAASQVAISGNFPGAVAIQTVAGSPGYLLITFTVNQSIAPGKYTAIVDITPPAQDTDDYTMDTADDNRQPDTSYPYIAGYPFPGTFTASRIITTHTRVNFLYGPGSSSPPALQGAASVTFSGGTPSFSGNAQVSITYSAAVAVPGIHNSKQIYKINLPGDNIGVGAGIATVNQSTLPTPDYLHTPYPQPAFTPERIVMNYISITPSTTGFWTAYAPMVSTLNPAVNSQMPWNILQHRNGSGPGGLAIDFNPMLLGGGGASYSGGTGGSAYTTQRLSNSYDNTIPVEAQIEPPSWKALTWFTVGFTIIDSNGNFQQVTVAGCSAATHPTWATTAGATCTDGTGLDPAGFTQPIITWRCLRVNTPARGILPATHRLPNPANGQCALPRYPVYWYSETIAKLKPPISGTALTIWGNYAQWTNIPSGGNPANGWQYGNQAKGWFIYSVSISRLKFVVRTQPGAEQGSAGGPAGSAGDTGKSAGGMSTTGEIAVTIGCMRSGAFVAFGTYASGQTIQVLWPIFTTDALVYQAAERVDLQAIAIANGGAGVAYGASVTFPLAAAYVTDTDKLLTLIAGN